MLNCCGCVQALPQQERAATGDTLTKVPKVLGLLLETVVRGCWLCGASSSERGAA